MFHTNYDTSSDKFQNYYKDVSLRMKNKELDILIVVNMFLTGFDATTMNTLWVDKNLKMHGLIQAFSRTNRILNSIKTFGNIVCFRNLQKRVDSAISLFGDKNAGGIVLLQSFKDYYYGYESVDGKPMPGYVDMMEDLNNKFPLSEPQIIGEQNQKDFITLFGAILRMRNLLLSFDEFKGNELISERDLQDYLGRYQDLRDEWKRKRQESTDITDDVVFEIELIRQIEINIDYILMLVKKYHDTHCEDKEVDVYKRQKLFHLLIEKDMTNAQLQQEAGFSANIITRLKRNGYISLESVESICRVLNCGVDDILEFIPEDDGGKENG